ncbi:MAG: 3-deoxy-7-phosphoheptulonate synthase [Rickettsiales bacterium]|jgi:3-deoxy-7-phosphoheptulonate synthase
MIQSSWSKNSWREFPIKQQPTYPDQKSLKEVEEQLSNYPRLVSCGEVNNLKSELSDVCNGKAFLLQGGDCAESFTEFSRHNIKSFFRTILQMTVALLYGAEKPIVKIGRIAGQYAKPRSTDFEEVSGIKAPSYRGDIVNSLEFNEQARTPDPKRLIEAYFHSAATMNYLKSLANGGYASLNNIEKWNSEFALTLKNNKIEEIIENVNKSIKFLKNCGVDIDQTTNLNRAEFYTSHEALLLNYEEAFTRKMSDGKYYDLSSHFLWIGDRTRSPDEAHVEFLRGIENPVAFKVGPKITKDDIIKLIDILNPNNTPGKLTLISRMGADNVEELLPPLVEFVKNEGRNVIWSCDPMHGNIIKTSNNYKTRKFNDILSEIKSFTRIHKSIGTYAGGVHFEMTGQDVTECLGGNQDISEDILKERYKTHCDPRLNSSQSLELAFLIIEELRDR